jgi:hypothetical protein
VCIGDGGNIKVMGELWLRVKDGCWVAASRCQSVYNLTVNQIMLPNIKQWDVEKLSHYYMKEMQIGYLLFH